jgi:hypothetical protein
LVRGHSKPIDVALLRRVVVLQAEVGGVQQLWCHVSDSSNRGRHRLTDTVRIRYYCDKSVVGETRMEIAVNEDICLCGIRQR